MFTHSTTHPHAHIHTQTHKYIAIFRDKTMDDKLMFIPINHPFLSLDTASLEPDNQNSIKVKVFDPTNKIM